jgi:hypothetical protein
VHLAVSGGVAEPVGPETLDAGARCPASQRPGESFAAESFAAAAQPEIRRHCERMLLAFAEVAQECLGAGLPDRDDPTSSSLAATDSDPARDEVEVVDLEVDDLADRSRSRT